MNIRTLEGRAAAGAALAAALWLSLVSPSFAQGGGRLETCRLGESCWGGAIDKSNERIAQQMRDARSGSPRIVTVEAPRRDPVPAAGKPLETVEMDMRFFSFGDCEKRFGSGSPKYQECTRVVASDEARQAKLDRMCRESFPTNDAEYERCHAPKRFVPDSAATAATAAGGAQGSSSGGAQTGATSVPAMSMPVGVAGGAAASSAAPAATPPTPSVSTPSAGASPAAVTTAARPTAVAQLPDALEPKPSVTWLGILLCMIGVSAGFVGMRKTYPWLGPLDMLVASAMSTLSAIAIYMLLSGITSKSSLLPHDTFVFVTFNLSWTATIWLMLRKVHTVRRIVSRGFLVGTAEWALLVLVAVLFGDVPSAVAGRAAPSVWSLPVGGGVLPFINVIVALAMVAICATGFALMHFLTRERESPITVRRQAGGYGDFEMTMRGLERRA